MKQLTEYNRVAGYLNKIFDKLNARYFENALTRPVITIQSTPRAYGHVSVQDIWYSDERTRKELNIGAGTLTRPIENVVATMLHEMCHIFNMQNGVKDTSRGYTYHNKNFKAAAEARDLHIEHDPRIGYSITTPTDALVEFCIAEELSEIKVCRNELGFAPRPTGDPSTGSPAPAGSPRPRAKSSTRKLVCPRCRASVRATRDILIICGECFRKDPAAPQYMTAE